MATKDSWCDAVSSISSERLRGDLETGSAYLLLNPDVYKPSATSTNLHKDATIRSDLHADVYTDSVQLGPLHGVNLPLGVLAKRRDNDWQRWARWLGYRRLVAELIRCLKDQAVISNDEVSWRL